MGAQRRALDLGLEFTPQQPGYLNLCIRTGNLLYTSGHVSDQKGNSAPTSPWKMATQRRKTASSNCSTRCITCTARWTD